MPSAKLSTGGSPEICQRTFHRGMLRPFSVGNDVLERAYPSIASALGRSQSVSPAVNLRSV
jgi:hypothetical protein